MVWISCGCVYFSTTWLPSQFLRFPYDIPFYRMMALVARTNCKMSVASIPSLTRVKRCMKPHKPLVAHRSQWWPSVIWTETMIWCLGTVRLLSKTPNPAPVSADDYLRPLTEESITTAKKKIPGVPFWRGIAGYSLAELFALYAIYRTGLFSRVGSMSGSLWFPGMKEYIFSHKPKRRPDCIYFSLGDKESKTRNPVLRSVRQNTEEIQAFYQAKGIDAVFQLNPDNHYNHAAERTAAGIAWLLRR